jgi:hypothetical protein
MAVGATVSSRQSYPAGQQQCRGDCPFFGVSGNSDQDQRSPGLMKLDSACQWPLSDVIRFGLAASCRDSHLAQTHEAQTRLGAAELRARAQRRGICQVSLISGGTAGDSDLDLSHVCGECSLPSRPSRSHRTGSSCSGFMLSGSSRAAFGPGDYWGGGVCAEIHGIIQASDSEEARNVG